MSDIKKFAINVYTHIRFMLNMEKLCTYVSNSFFEKQFRRNKKNIYILRFKYTYFEGAILKRRAMTQNNSPTTSLTRFVRKVLRVFIYELSREHFFFK